MKVFDKNGDVLFWASVQHYDERDFLPYCDVDVPVDKRFHLEMHNFWLTYKARHPKCCGATIAFVWDKPFNRDNGHVALVMGVAPRTNCVSPNTKNSINNNKFHKKIYLQAALGRALKKLNYRLKRVTRKSTRIVDDKEVACTESFYVAVPTFTS